VSLLSRIPWRSLAVAAVALALAAIPGTSGLLLLERGRVFAGEAWRLATGHLIHLSAYHLTWDVAALVVLGLLFERELGRRWWGLLATSALVVSGGVLLLAPGLEIYSGLSGVLNGLWVGSALYLARVEARRGERPLQALYLACVIAAVAKIAVEAVGGVSLFTHPAELGGFPVPLAHALGALAGALWSFQIDDARISNIGRMMLSSPRSRSMTPSRPVQPTSARSTRPVCTGTANFTGRSSSAWLSESSTA